MSVPHDYITSHGSSENMGYIKDVTGLSAAEYGTDDAMGVNAQQDTTMGVAFPVPASAQWTVLLPVTHVSLPVPDDNQFLGSAGNMLFWKPPGSGDQKIFDSMAAKLEESLTSKKGDAINKIPSSKLVYSCAKDAADAKRGRTSEWRQVANPSFPTTNAHDCVYVKRLVIACGDFTKDNPGDSESAVDRFKKIVREEPARVEQACWALLEEVKARHIANANEYKASGSFEYSGDFDRHITALCDDLLAVNKTACKTICTNCNGLAAIVGNPRKRKDATEANHRVNVGRNYVPKAKKPRKSRQSTATLAEDDISPLALPTPTTETAAREQENVPIDAPASFALPGKMHQPAPDNALPYVEDMGPPSAEELSILSAEELGPQPAEKFSTSSAEELGRVPLAAPEPGKELKRKRGDTPFEDIEPVDSSSTKKMRTHYQVRSTSTRVPSARRQESVSAASQPAGLLYPDAGHLIQRRPRPSRLMTDGEERAFFGVDYARPGVFITPVMPGLPSPSDDFLRSTSSLGWNDLSASTGSSNNPVMQNAGAPGLNSGIGAFLADSYEGPGQMSPNKRPKKQSPNIDWENNLFVEFEPGEHGADDGFASYAPEDYDL